MKWRLALVAGFVAGYVIGARAGRARDEQLRRRLERLRDSRVFDRLQAAVELGVERLRHDEPAPGAPPPPADVTVEAAPDRSAGAGAARPEPVPPAPGGP